MNENRDKQNERKHEEETMSHKPSAGATPGNDKGNALTEVKNAHATGDGSYGRNETGVPEDFDEEKGRESVY